MGAREKLNKMHVYACLAFATFLGLAWESWLMFGAVLVIGFGLCVAVGDIRPNRRN